MAPLLFFLNLRLISIFTGWEAIKDWELNCPQKKLCLSSLHILTTNKLLQIQMYFQIVLDSLKSRDSTVCGPARDKNIHFSTIVQTIFLIRKAICYVFDTVGSDKPQLLCTEQEWYNPELHCKKHLVLYKEEVNRTLVVAQTCWYIPDGEDSCIRAWSP